MPVLSPSNAGLEQPGHYRLRASVDNGLFRANLSCSFRVASRVSGLRVLHPAPQGSRVYLPTNHTWLLLRLSSGTNATASSLGDSRSVPFVATCPAAVAALCNRDSNDTWFAVLPLGGLGEGLSTHVLVAENAVSSQNITVTVKVEEPIRGLRATPDPESRVLLNTRVVSACLLLLWTLPSLPRGVCASPGAARVCLPRGRGHCLLLSCQAVHCCRHSMWHQHWCCPAGGQLSCTSPWSP